MKEEDIKRIVVETVRNELKSGLFTARKLTDFPTEGNQIVPRKYITRNGASTVRPISSVLGEQFFDTTLGQPIWWDGTSYIDAAGNVV